LNPNTSPGELNKRIALQIPSKVPDGMGGFVVTWVDTATVWAAIWPISAAETIEAGKMGMTVTHRIRIRYRSVLRPSWRIAFGGRYFNIVSIIDPNTAHRWLDILCKEAA
jgi:SPP1 family predicted phage head-tail adaptor